MYVCREFCVLSGRGLCDEMITHPEESCRLWCVFVWSRNLKNREVMASIGPQRRVGVGTDILLALETNESSSSLCSLPTKYTF